MEPHIGCMLKYKYGCQMLLPLRFNSFNDLVITKDSLQSP